MADRYTVVTHVRRFATQGESVWLRAARFQQRADELRRRAAAEANAETARGTAANQRFASTQPRIVSGSRAEAVALGQVQREVRQLTAARERDIRMAAVQQERARAAAAAQAAAMRRQIVAQRAATASSASTAAAATAGGGAVAATRAGGRGIAGLVTAGLGGFGVAASIKGASNFEAALRDVGAIADVSGKRLAKLGLVARKVGVQTASGAAEAARAAGELVKGGIAIKDVQQGALQAALEFGKAGGIEMEEAANTMARAISAFKLEGKDASHVGDLFANAANATTSSVKDLVFAFQQGSSAAQQVGYDLDETILALASLSKAGLQNSDAGTSLKSALIQLNAPSKQAKETIKKLNLEFYDSQGNFKKTAELADELNSKLHPLKHKDLIQVLNGETDSLKDLNQQQTIAALKSLAGTDGFRALAAMMTQTGDGARKLAKQVSKEGEAHRIATQRLQGAEGAMKRFAAVREELAITIGTPVLKPLTQLAEAAMGVLSSDRVKKKMAELGQDLARFGEGLRDGFKNGVSDGTFEKNLHSIATALETIGSVLGSVLKAMAGLNKIFHAIPEPIRDAAIAFGVYTAAARLAISTTGRFGAGTAALIAGGARQRTAIAGAGGVGGAATRAPAPFIGPLTRAQAGAQERGGLRGALANDRTLREQERRLIEQNRQAQAAVAAARAREAALRPGGAQMRPASMPRSYGVGTPATAGYRIMPAPSRVIQGVAPIPGMTGRNPLVLRAEQQRAAAATAAAQRNAERAAAARAAAPSIRDRYGAIGRTMIPGRPSAGRVAGIGAAAGIGGALGSGDWKNAALAAGAIGMMGGPVTAAGAAIAAGAGTALVALFKGKLKKEAEELGRTIGNATKLSNGKEGSNLTKKEIDRAGELQKERKKVDDQIKAFRLSRQVGDMEGSAGTIPDSYGAEAQKKLNKLEREQGGIYAKGATRELKGYDFVGTEQAIRKIREQFKTLGPEGKKAGLDAMVQTVAGMEANGQLATGAAARIIERLRKEYGGGGGVAGKAYAAGVAAELSKAKIELKFQQTSGGKNGSFEQARKEIKAIGESYLGLAPDAKTGFLNVKEQGWKQIRQLNRLIEKSSGDTKRQLIKDRNSLRDALVAYGTDSKPAFSQLAKTVDTMLGTIKGKIDTFIANLRSNSPIIDSIAGAIQGPVGDVLGGLVTGQVNPTSNRKGGTIPRYATGGQVAPAYVSPGEEIFSPSGRSMGVVPGAWTGQDSVFGHLPVGGTVITGHGRQLMAQGYSLAAARAMQAPHFAGGGSIGPARTGAAAYAKGLRDQKLITAIAVAGAESGWNPSATNRNDNGSIDRGLWQINSIHSQYDAGRLFDVAYNARAMKAISSTGSNWQPWATYNNGAYRGFLGRARSAAGKASGGEGEFEETEYESPIMVGRSKGRTPLIEGAFAAGVARSSSGLTPEIERRHKSYEIVKGVQDAYRQTQYTRTLTAAGGGTDATEGVTPRVNNMIDWAKTQSEKYPNYVYGGGHGQLGVGPFDCSGFVSGILGAGGFMPGRAPMTTDGLKTLGKEGDGSAITWGVRGSSGRSAHTMIKLGNSYWEAGSSGVGKRSTWSGSFPIHRHPDGYARGGKIRRPVAATGIPKPIRQRISKPGAFVPSSPNYVGQGLRRGGRLRRYAGKGGSQVTGTGAATIINRSYASVETRVNELPKWVTKLIEAIQKGIGTYERKPASNTNAELGKLTPKAQTNTEYLTKLAQSIDDATTGYIFKIREKIQREANKAGTKASRDRLRGVLAVIDDRLGARVGKQLYKAQQYQDALGQNTTFASQQMRIMGVDENSVKGINAQRTNTERWLAGQDSTRAGLQKALSIAKRSKDPATIAQAQDAIKGFENSVLEARASLADLGRAAIEAATAERAAGIERQARYAQLTTDKGDDIAAADAAAAEAYANIDRYRGDPNKMADYDLQYREAQAQASQLRTDKARDDRRIFGGTSMAQLDVEQALAGLTETEDDDKWNLAQRESLLSNALENAKAMGDNEDIIQIANDLRAVREQQKADAEAAKENERSLADLTQQLIDEQIRTRRVVEGQDVVGIFAAALSGAIGGNVLAESGYPSGWRY